MKRRRSDQESDTLVEISVAIVVERDGDGFHAYTPALKGLHVDGATQHEAVERAKKAVDVYLESLAKHGEKLPEGPGLIVHKTQGKTSLRNVRTQWHSIRPSGTNLEIRQPTY
ncbi:MAG: type II toxin-antitoxin system HicB family antitoxin [Nitrospira sp.]|nr:type II toxin-antitoxin system HicB family antitoxin [Nitrospira sp.]